MGDPVDFIRGDFIFDPNAGKFNVMKMLLLLAFALSACGGSQAAETSPPAPEPAAPAFPNGSLVVNEPNPQCPGAFDGAVNTWADEADVRMLAQALASMPEFAQRAACAVKHFAVADDNFFASASASLDTIAFHPALIRLKPTLAQYLTWKERQVFEPEAVPHYDTGEAPVVFRSVPDDSAAMLAYVLAHELGHVAGFRPAWRAAYLQLCPDHCAANSWEATGQMKSGRFGWSSQPCFYQLCAKRVAAADKTPLYQALAASDFVSLYATSNSAEDAAESFAALVVFDTWHWSLTVESDGQVLLDAAAHWQSPQIAAKRALIAQLAGAPAS